jgi:hypothetical protein
MKTRKNWIEEHDRLVSLFKEASESLKKYPGVVSVEIGIKETGGNLTDNLSFRVYVKKKLDKQDLASEAVIPETILGIKTDVIEYDIPVITFDDKKYRPLKGGIQIANEEDSTGTLGCIARLNSDSSIVVLSNAHVLMGGNASGTVDAGQPKISGSCCCTCDEIGEVINSKLDGTVDCAIVKLKSGVSGVNDIRILNDDGTDGFIDGAAGAVVSATDKVIKVGRTSDKTEGTVVSITHSTGANASEGTPARTSQILVKPNTGFTKFQDRGDSGSVLVNNDHEVVGLMWGAYLTPGSSLFGHGIACPISNVLLEMGIELIIGSLTTSLAYANAPPTSELATGTSDRIRLMELLEARLERSAQGKAILKLVYMHRNEVLNLVNHNRAVTVTWHRQQGPAFLAAIARSVKEPAYRIPNEIEGVRRRHALMSMLAALEEKGSPQLKADIGRYSLLLLQTFSQYDTVDEIINVLENAVSTEAETDLVYP